MSDADVLFEGRWIHPDDAHAIVSRLLAAAMRTFPPSEPLLLTVRRPTIIEGCWCYRNGTSLEGRPHPHEHSLGGCPVEPAGDWYVWLEARRAAVPEGDTSDGTGEEQG